MLKALLKGLGGGLVLALLIDIFDVPERWAFFSMGATMAWIISPGVYNLRKRQRRAPSLQEVA